eukprot:2912854-Lingulodinium_polyedra.AAC.1
MEVEHGLTGETVEVEKGYKLAFDDAGWGVLVHGDERKEAIPLKNVFKRKVFFHSEQGLYVHDGTTKKTSWLRSLWKEGSYRYPVLMNEGRATTLSAK